MSEMDKLGEYLKEHHINYWRGQRDDSRLNEYARLAYGLGPAQQIIVYDEDGFRQWDAVIGLGTYGVDRGLLEVMGDAVVRPSDGDSVCGFLTAKNIIERLEESNGRG